MLASQALTLAHGVAARGLHGSSMGRQVCKLYTCRQTCSCPAAQRVRQGPQDSCSAAALCPLCLPVLSRSSVLCRTLQTSRTQQPVVLSAVQDPVIFSGTVRANLDPFDTAGGDTNIWQALQQAGMAATIKEMKVSGAGWGSLHLMWCAALRERTALGFWLSLLWQTSTAGAAVESKGAAKGGCAGHHTAQKKAALRWGICQALREFPTGMPQSMGLKLCTRVAACYRGRWEALCTASEPCMPTLRRAQSQYAAHHNEPRA